MNKNQQQPWHILGAGAIGCLWAHAMQQWQLDVTILTRNKQQHQQLQTQGIQLTDGKVTYTSRPASLYPGLGGAKISNLLVCTKAYATLSAVESWRKLLHPQANILLLQNGMGTAQALQTRLPKANIYCATTTDGAWRQGPWRVVRAGMGDTQIGTFSAHLSSHTAPAQIAHLLTLSAAHTNLLRLHWHADILTPIWHKLAINSVINALTAVYQINNGELIKHSQARPRLEQLCKETEDVMSRCHITPIPHGLLQQALRVLNQTADNQSSMLQDCLADRPTEIDAINGFIIQQGSLLHLPCAAHKQICDDLHQQYPRPS
ncbi:MAG: 2-dehydropantoate 2-reductase [Gammaproteobacteria bacterium]|nr:2-dehydropantoate 2-reductase [Gammaproteobacteria bacterium]